MKKVLKNFVLKLCDGFTSVTKIDWVTGRAIKPIAGIETVGIGKGSWLVPVNLLSAQAICYCAGVGEDVTFDLALIDRFNCQVFAFDPTPKAQTYVAKTVTASPQFHFLSVGLWDQNETLKFYAPANATHVSHSVLNLQQTNEYFEAACKRLATLMAELGHQRIDLLKLDIEGAEYKVLNSLIEDKLPIDIICVEFDEIYNSLDRKYLHRIRSAVLTLLEHGYEIVAIAPSCNYTFVNRELLNARP